MFERLDHEAQATAHDVPSEARALFHPFIDTSHLLLALARGETAPSILLRCMRVTYDVLTIVAMEKGKGISASPRHNMGCEDEYYRVLLASHTEADRFGSTRVTPMHVLRAMLLPPRSAASALLEGGGVSRLAVLEKTKAALR